MTGAQRFNSGVNNLVTGKIVHKPERREESVPSEEPQQENASAPSQQGATAQTAQERVDASAAAMDRLSESLKSLEGRLGTP